MYSPENNVLHVGRTIYGKNGLNQRLNNHRRGKSSFMRLYSLKEQITITSDYSFKYIEVKDGRKRALLEALTIGLLCPAHIGTGAKK